jgi:hypothetical protein
MSLHLAPYNDAMRLGQGFNSYTHQLCIDGAVEVKQRTLKNAAASSTGSDGLKNTSQVSPPGIFDRTARRDR